MDKIIEVLGLDINVLIATLVNFAILLFFVYKIGYKQILTFVEERTKKIEDGLKNAEDAKKALDDATAEQQRVLADARTEAQEIIANAREQAQVQANEMLEKNERDIADKTERALTQIDAKRDEMMREVRTEAVALIVQATEKVLGKSVDANVNTDLIKQSLSEIDA